MHYEDILVESAYQSSFEFFDDNADGIIDRDEFEVGIEALELTESEAEEYREDFNAVD